MNQYPPNKFRVRVTKTASEMDLIKQSLQAMGKPDFDKYLRLEANNLLKKFEENPDLIPDNYNDTTIRKEIRLHESTYEELLKISEKIKKPVSTIIDEFLIIPLHTKNI